MKAAKFVSSRLDACLPPGVPPSYKSIVAASYVGNGKDRRAEASLIMFDGLPAKVSVSTIGLMPHRFFELPGGDVSFENGRWIRIDRSTLEPVTAQMQLELTEQPHD